MTLDQMLRWYRDPDENSNSSFEDIGDWFYAETGRLRPGKSWPIYMHEPEDNQEFFRNWCKEKQREFRATLVKLVGPVPNCDQCQHPWNLHQYGQCIGFQASGDECECIKRRQ